LKAAAFNCSMGMDFYFRMPPYGISEVLEEYQTNELAAPESAAMCRLARMLSPAGHLKLSR